MTKISIQFYNDREDETKQLVSDAHELLFCEVVSDTNRLKNLGSETELLVGRTDQL